MKQKKRFNMKRTSHRKHGFIQIQFIKVFLINLSMTSQIYDEQGENGFKTLQKKFFFIGIFFL